MPRLIDADKLRKDILDLPNCYNGFSDTYDKAMIIDLIDDQPTVDAERHGHWIECGWSVRCSECGYDMPWSVRNYCPHCGAKMDEVEDAEEE